MGRINTNYPKRRRRTTVAIGDLNQRINLQRRVLLTQFETGDKDMETFQTFTSPWAMVETNSGAKMFNGVEIAKAFTHTFYIRHRTDLEDQETWVEYKSQRYDILDIENLDERDEFLALRCKLTGTNESTNEASWG